MSKPQPLLNEMPYEVKKLIIQNLDTKTKLKCRQVNKSFKSIVEKCEISISTFSIYTYPTSIAIELPTNTRVYDTRTNKITITYPITRREMESIVVEIEEGKSMMDYAIGFLRKILDTFKKVQIDHFSLYPMEDGLMDENFYDFYNCFKNAFQERELHVTNLEVDGMCPNFEEVLKLFNPESIRFFRADGAQEHANFSKITQLDVFKSLRIFEFHGSVISGITAGDLKHLEYCDIRRFKGIDVKTIKEILSDCMQKPDGQTTLYCSDIDLDAFIRELGPFNTSSIWRWQNGESVFKVCHVS